MNLIEIFKAGKRPDASGVEYDITTDMLKQAVENYDPDLHEAPLVVGHPKDDDPSYGWAKSLVLDGDILKAEPQQVDPAFAEMVNSGRFKKISASFYLPNNPNNPKKGSLYLRHIGFLGAMPPAVKGLRTASFNEQTEEDIVCFTEELPSLNFNQPEDKTMDKNQIAELEAQLAAAQKAQAEAEQAKAEAEAAKAKAETAKAAAENENAELKAAKAAAEEAQAQAEMEATKAEDASFCEGLIQQGKLLPRMKEAAIALLAHTANITAGRTADFGEGEDLHSLTKAFLNAAPQVVQFGEVATPERAYQANTQEVSYAESDDPARVELDRRVRAYMQDHKVDYATALAAVQ